MPTRPDAIILCGGAGSRLRSVTGDDPKSLAGVGGRPFLELLLRQLLRQGYSRVILAVGYRASAIRSHFGDSFLGLQLRYSEERTPLGTGGALRKAADLAESEDVLAMNGDSYTPVDLVALERAHQEGGAEASLVVVPINERGDCGSVSVDAAGAVLRFEEKGSEAAATHFNGGVYLMKREMLSEIPGGKQLSLENEVFPRWIEMGRRVRAYEHTGICVDIGTPERYQDAQDALAFAELESASATNAERQR